LGINDSQPMGSENGQNCWQQSANKNDAVSRKFYVVVFQPIGYKSKRPTKRKNNLMPEMTNIDTYEDCP